MAGKFFALLVGIDDYPEEANVDPLRGCVNDVNHLKDYLKGNVALKRYIKTLKNSDATRKNIIRSFREHLGKAGEHDVVFFHYSGHGSREMAAPGFKEYFSESMGETLVCYDSRIDDGYDLADKELAVLLREVAKKNPHIVVSLDCCHSGSGTRDADDLDLGEVRQTRGGRFSETPRPLDSYLDGSYKKMDTVRIPRPSHMLMAACGRRQKAFETKDHRGVFSTTLLEVLAKSGPNVSYADLFVHCRHGVLRQTRSQTPQFETFSHFNPYSTFLDGRPLEKRARCHVYFDGDERKGDWKMDCGALHGLPKGAGKVIEAALYPESTGASKGNKIVGYGKVSYLGAQKSTLLLDFDTSREACYYAEIISLPAPPIPVFLEGDLENKSLVKNSRSQWANFVFTDEPETAKYTLSVQEARFLLSQKDADLLIQGAEGDPRQGCDYMFSILERVVRWERGLALQNYKTALDPDGVEFTFFHVSDDGRETEYPGDSVTLDLVNTGGVWGKIRVRFRVRNRAAGKLHALLVHFSRKYGIHILRNELLVPAKGGEGWVTLWGESDIDYIKPPEDTDEAVYFFQLVVSTEKVDDFLLEQKGLELGKIFSNQELREIEEEPGIEEAQTVTGDWFTKPLVVKIVKQPNRSGDKGVYDDGEK